MIVHILGLLTTKFIRNNFITVYFNWMDYKSRLPSNLIGHFKRTLDGLKPRLPSYLIGH